MVLQFFHRNYLILFKRDVRILAHQRKINRSCQNIETSATFSVAGKPLNIITALNDSDTCSHDNWRNKGVNERNNNESAINDCSFSAVNDCSFSAVNDCIPRRMQECDIDINYNITQDFKLRVNIINTSNFMMGATMTQHRVTHKEEKNLVFVLKTKIGPRINLI